MLARTQREDAVTATDKPILLAKAGGSGDDGCPSVFAHRGQFVVLGQQRDPADLPNVLPGESAVTIDIDTVRRAIANYDAGDFS